MSADARAPVHECRCSRTKAVILINVSASLSAIIVATVSSIKIVVCGPGDKVVPKDIVNGLARVHGTISSVTTCDPPPIAIDCVIRNQISAAIKAFRRVYLYARLASVSI